MRLLLDTHVLLWALISPDKMADASRSMIQTPENEVLFSAASIWEIAIKVRLDRLRPAVHPIEISKAAIESGFVELPVRSDAAARVADLPMHHRDPFDRLLIGQALTEPARFLTADRALLAYSDIVTLV